MQVGGRAIPFYADDSVRAYLKDQMNKVVDDGLKIMFVTIKFV
jgi:hypothetical protein